MPKPLVLVPWGIILVLQGPWEYPTGHLGIQISIFIDDGKRLWAFPFFRRSPRRGGVGGDLVMAGGPGAIFAIIFALL